MFYSASYINQHQAANPAQVNGNDSTLTQICGKYLMQDLISRFRIQCPKTWNKSMFWYTLFQDGYIGVINTKAYGVLPFPCQPCGETVQYMPKSFLVTNPHLPQSESEYSIGRTGVLVYFSDDFGGLTDLVDLYAQLMAETLTTYTISLRNSRFGYAFAAKNSGVGAAIKQAFADIFNGKAVTIIHKGIFDDNGASKLDLFSGDAKNSFICPECLDLVEKIRNRFLTEIGIPTANTEKKERLITAEVESVNAECNNKVLHWLDNLNACGTEISNIFGVDVHFSLTGGVNNDPVSLLRRHVGDGTVHVGQFETPERG